MRRKGQNPIPLPNAIRTPDAALNREFDVMRRALQALAGRLPERQKWRESKTPRRFEPVSLRLSGETWQMGFSEGFVLDSHVRNEAASGVPPVPTESAVQVRVPRIKVGSDYVPISSVQLTGTELTNWTRPELGLPGVTCWIYLKVRTDWHGNILELYDQPDPADDRPLEIIASATELDAIHHEPEDDTGNNGVEGEYLWQIAKCVSDGESPARPVIMHEGYQSDLVWQEAFVLKNVGMGAGHYKEFDNVDDVLELRGTEGRYGIEDTKGSEDVYLDFDGKNHGTGETVWCPAGDITDGGEADFRTLRGGVSGDGDANGIRGEITVEKAPADAADDANADPRVFQGLRVVGNDFFKTGAGTVSSMTVKDGLVTAFTDGDDGEDLNLVVHQIDYSKVTVSPYNNLVQWVGDDASPVTLYWRGGIYIGSSDDIADPGGAPKVVSVDYWVAGS